MTAQYRRFDPVRRPEEYLGQAGPYFGLALSPHALEMIAEGKTHRHPTGMVVRGEWIQRDLDGTETHLLDLAVTKDYIEGHTYFRADDKGKLRWECPECGRTGGGHTKTCNFE